LDDERVRRDRYREVWRLTDCWAGVEVPVEVPTSWAVVDEVGASVQLAERLDFFLPVKNENMLTIVGGLGYDQEVR
jgi:hypothetical protein